jgi:hypothetical protein
MEREICNFCRNKSCVQTYTDKTPTRIETTDEGSFIGGVPKFSLKSCVIAHAIFEPGVTQINVTNNS